MTVRRHVLTLGVVSVLCSAALLLGVSGAPAGAVSASWNVGVNQAVDLGVYNDGEFTVTLSGAGNAMLSIDGVGGTGISGEDVCFRGTRTVVSGPGILVGCPGDTYYDPGNAPVGMGCSGDTEACVLEFVPDTGWSFTAEAIVGPSEYGGVASTYAVEFTTGSPATTTTTPTTTTTSSTTTTTTTPPSSTTTTTTVPPVVSQSWEEGDLRDVIPWLFIAVQFVVFGTGYVVGNR